LVQEGIFVFTLRNLVHKSLNEVWIVIELADIQLVDDVQLKVSSFTVNLMLRGSVHPDGSSEISQLGVRTALLDHSNISQTSLDEEGVTILLHLFVVSMQVEREGFGCSGLVNICCHDIYGGLSSSCGANSTPTGLILLAPLAHRADSLHERGSKF